MSTNTYEVRFGALVLEEFEALGLENEIPNQQKVGARFKADFTAEELKVFRASVEFLIWHNREVRRETGTYYRHEYNELTRLINQLITVLKNIDAVQPISA